MLAADKISERFEKWDNKNWLAIEKDLSVFQKKVADTMIKLGSFDFVPEQQNPCQEDECVLGEDLYVDLVRPKLYRMDFVPKDKKDKKEDDKKKDKGKDKQKKDEESSEEEEKDEPAVEIKEIKQEKGKKPHVKKEKPKKAPKVKKEDLMKQQIIKQTFAKEIDFSFKTFSMENLQIEFGFRQKKLELKISTFFYIACFIRKNKVKQQIDESLIMELINILIKVFKIFKGYEGKSFLDSTNLIPVSAKCMEDLKSCMDGLIQYYGYNIKKVINKYPKLVYYTDYDKYFPTLDIKPYNSQVEFVNMIKQAVKSDRSTILFYKTMIGSGKTTASISIANIISEMKLLNDKQYKNLQLIYCCVIKSVRAQVGKLAYNEKLKFALGAMDTLKNRKNLENKTPEQEGLCDKEPSDYFPRIINSWSCDQVEVVDLIIGDLFTTKEFLSESLLNPKIKIRREGRMERQNIILFIDEPTAFCSATSSVTSKLFEILSESPPKVIVFASATMPEKEQLAKTIELVRLRNPDVKVSDVSSKEFQIGCQFCTFEGQIIYPHSGVKNKVELDETINLLSRNPFLMRLYTGPSLFSLLDRCKKAGLKKMPDLQNFGQIRQTDILKETLSMLTELKNYPDEVIQEVCKVDKELDNIANDEVDAEDAKKKKGKKEEDDDDFFEGGEKEAEVTKKSLYVNLRKLLKSDAYKFLGGCLIATDDPITFAQTTFSKWIDGIPSIKKLLERYERDKLMLQEKLDGIDETKELRPEEKAKKKAEVEDEFEPKFDFPETKRINTSAHYQKYCKNKNPIHNSKLIKPIIIEIVGLELFKEVEDWMIQMLFCGVAIYSKKVTSGLYLNKVDDLAASGYLAYIICDESLCYGTNFPISNVILNDSLATKLTINELFQLMGRAGRVGQSWTARAFLEEQGAAKLKDYIKTKDKSKYSTEAEIFEGIAEKLLENPPLHFKSKRYLIQPEVDSEFIKITYREHFSEDESKCIVDRICLAAYQDNKWLTTSVEIKEATNKSSRIVYRLFSGRLRASDLPTIVSKEQNEIYDVALFYSNEEQFIRRTFEKAINRILADTFKNLKLSSIKNVYSYFSAESFLNFKANTYVAVVKVEGETETLSGLKYTYNEIEVGPASRVISDFNLKEIGKLGNEDNDETKRAGHLKLLDTCEPYKDYFKTFVEKSISKESTAEYISSQILDNMLDMTIANEPTFIVDRLARPLWGKINSEIKKN